MAVGGLFLHDQSTPGPLRSQAAMHALILVDPDLAERERSILDRLEIGLVDEGLRVTHVLPGDEAHADEHGVYARVIVGPPRLWFRGPKGQAAWIAKRLETEPAPELIHVLGDRLWPFGMALSHLYECPLALELWSTRSVEQASQLDMSEPTAPGLLAADAALFEHATSLGLGSRVRLAPWGVRAEGEPTDILPEGRAPAIVLLGTGRDPETIRNALRQMGPALASRRDVELFMDAPSAAGRDVWHAAKEAGLQDRLSIIARIERARELILHADMLIYPESPGEQRSLLLEAMGRGLAVIASRDEANSLISPDRCGVVDPREPAALGTALDRLLSNPVEARSLGRSAWAFIKAERRASAHVTAVLDAYEWLTGQNSLPFSDGAV